MVMPERISASGMFGVRTSASGRSFSHSAVTASSRSSFAPDVATMTGSTTMCFAPYSFNFAAIVSISSAEDTMPILTASGKMSVNTASSCSARKCGVESKMSVTPVVFWAVRAVTAHRAKTPLAVMVLMSAWIPAPPLESLPAMVNAVLMVITSFPFCIQQGFIKRYKVVPPVYRWGMLFCSSRGRRPRRPAEGSRPLPTMQFFKGLCRERS